MSGAMQAYLLSTQGTLVSRTVEVLRSIHNQTAGSPDGVAAAMSFGGMRHMLCTRLGTNGGGQGEFLSLDVWNSMEGLNQFFADPVVQEQAGQIFSERDPVVWQPADGFLSYHFPAPHGKN